ncbi:MAG: hypothetical protein CVT89_04115 [Candidatus Altiarchaeales archaeon HGW-Altiarchaeales-2]|nr:MAG: hypothetical protein CVT89_04115 [Candidatus Altiarchaeales archaeon HGW-Altiarchaeales-2]
METLTINIPKDLEIVLNHIVEKFGFKSKQEFVEAATKEKVLEMKKRLFFEISDEIAEGLRKRGISEEEILEEFEKTRRK